VIPVQSKKKLAKKTKRKMRLIWHPMFMEQERDLNY
jgi:hypothetical protein